MPAGWVAAAAGVIGAVTSADSARKSSHAQQDEANQASQMQTDQFGITNENQRPYREAGYTALNQLGKGTAEGGYFNHQFDANDLKNNLAPNYDFMLNQGQNQIQNKLNASGGLIGGNALQGINEFSQNYAQNAYQQAFQNYTANQSNIYNRLSNIAGLGQTANQATGEAGMNAVNNAGNYLTSGAAANAAGIVGKANAVNNGLSGLSSAYMWGQLNNNKNWNDWSSEADWD